MEHVDARHRMDVWRRRRVWRMKVNTRWVYALVLLVAVAVAAVTAHAKPPPAGESESAQVDVWAVDPGPLAAAALPTLAVPKAGGKAAFAPGGGVGGGRFWAISDSRSAALDTALGAARSYLRTLVAAQNDWLARANHGASSSPRRDRARRLVLSRPSRYMLHYDESLAAPKFGGAASRGALIGALLAVLAIVLLESRRLRAAPAGRGAVGDSRLSRPPLALLPVLAVGVSSGLIVGATAVGPASLYSLLLVALLFASAAIYVLEAGDHGIRVVLACIVAISPFRGALLALAGAMHLPHALLTVNALQPALIAAIGVVALRDVRGLVARTPRPLLLAAVAVAGVAILDFATQTVGLHVYAIGFVQYLTYPVLAVVVWPAVRRRDIEPYAALLVGLGVAVAGSIFLEAAHLVRFVEAVPPVDPVTGTARYGGATGSYLHASMFLGTVAPIALGFVLTKRARDQALAAAALACIFAGFVLTYSRGGFAISAAAVLVLLVVLEGRRRVFLAATAAAAVVLALGAGFVAGISPAKVGSRMASSFSLHSDPSNSRRLHDMKGAVRRFEHAALPQKILGQGLAATGNTRKLAGLQPFSTESYFLKLLVEVGLVGLLAVGSVLIWAALVFIRLAMRARGRPDLQSLGAAGLGLTLYAFVFPTLEPQLIAVTWWLLLVLGLKALQTEPAREAAVASGPRRTLAAPVVRLIRARRSRSAAITVAGTLGGALAALAAAIVAARVLDQTEFVLFGVGLALNSLIVQVADLGLATVTVTETAADWASRRFGVTQAKLRQLARHRLLASVVVAGIASILAVVLPGIGPYREVTLVVAFGAVFGNFSLFLVALLQGAQRFGAAAAVQATIGAARLALVCACALAGATSTPMLLGYTAAAPLIGILLAALLLRARAPSAEARDAAPRPARVSLDRRLRGAMSVGGLASAGLLNADVLLLLLLSTTSQVAAYVAAWRIAAGVLLLTNALSFAVAPSVMIAPDAWREAKRLLKTGVGITACLCAVAPVVTLVGLAVLGKAGDDAGPALAVLLVAFALDAFVVIVYQIYLRVGHAEVVATAAVLELLTMVSVTIVLRDHGALAPALGQLLARVVGAAVVTLPIVAASRKRLDWFSKPASVQVTPALVAALEAESI